MAYFIIVFDAEVNMLCTDMDITWFVLYFLKIKFIDNQITWSFLFDHRLDGEWTTTVDGDSFLVYDNGADSSDRILVFRTHLGLRRSVYQLGNLQWPAYTSSYPTNIRRRMKNCSQQFRIRWPSLGSTSTPQLWRLTLSKLWWMPSNQPSGHMYTSTDVSTISHSLHGGKYSLGLVQRYCQEEDVKLFCRILDCLAFLPEEDVPEGMIYLRENIPDGFEPLLQYFDNTYVFGSYCQIQPPQRPDGTIPPIRIHRSW